MSLRNFILLLIGFIAVSSYMMLHHSTNYIIFLVIIAVLAALYELYRYMSTRHAEVDLKKPRFQETHDEDGNLYHNDFSKVPAGTVDPEALPPIPRSMNIVDPKMRFEQSFEEDLKRAGLEDMLEDEKDDHKK